MAVFVLKDAALTVNSVNLSSYVTSITLNYETDSVEVTAMGATGHKFTGGLQNISLDVTLNQDFAASQVAATLDALIGSTTTVVVKPTSAAVSATNPSSSIAPKATGLQWLSLATRVRTCKRQWSSCKVQWRWLKDWKDLERSINNLER